MLEPAVERCDVKGFPFLETSVIWNITSFFVNEIKILPKYILGFYFLQNEKKSEFSGFFWMKLGKNQMVGLAFLQKVLKENRRPLEARQL